MENCVQELAGINLTPPALLRGSFVGEGFMPSRSFPPFSKGGQGQYGSVKFQPRFWTGIKPAPTLLHNDLL